MTKEEKTALDEAKASLQRLQTFDAKSLIREAELGSKKNFSSAVLPAQRLIELYSRLTLQALDDFPSSKLDAIKGRANADFALFDSILQFDADKPTAERDSIVVKIAAAYQPAFDTLFSLIAYSFHRAADFQRLDSDARGAIQDVKDQAAEILKMLEKTKFDADTVVSHVREAAAEIGVTKEAEYFSKASKEHGVEATKWETYTIRFAALVILFAVGSVFIHKIPFLEPKNTYEAVQLAISKILVFTVLSTMLYFSVRNFHSNKHNSIVNGHRQNALLTYKALVDAAGAQGNRDVILMHAAACIYSPQPTGYTADGGTATPSSKSVVELLSKTAHVSGS